MIINKIDLNLIHNKSYSRLDPVPDKDFFSEYYSFNALESLKFKQPSIRKRDLEHYDLTKKLFSKSEKTKKNIKFTYIYYFTIYFFSNLFFEKKYCESWKKSKISDDKNSDVIRAFGDLKLNYNF